MFIALPFRTYQKQCVFGFGLGFLRVILTPSEASGSTRVSAIDEGKKKVPEPPYK